MERVERDRERERESDRDGDRERNGGVSMGGLGLEMR